MTASAPGFYDRHVLPHLVHFVCGLKPIRQQREKVVPLARGRVLEIGIGSALNLPYYDRGRVTALLGLEPAPEMSRKAKRAAALKEMGRVLKPGGRLLFLEHGLAPDAKVRKWQDRITPLWKRIGGGGHLNRDIPALISQGGFRIADMETMYLPGWRPATFNYWGSAEPQ